MWYKIKEGKHRAYPLSLGIHLCKIQELYEVIFDDSCRYDLGSIDQEDTNKLFGWSYGLHHNNSVRVGWRYNKESDDIELLLYIYEDGKRDIIELEQLNIPIGEKWYLSLASNSYGVSLDVRHKNDETVYGRAYSINRVFKPKWGYNLGLWFGGNNSAPKDMRIWLKKV